MSDASDVNVHFPSLASLRAAHSELLKRHRESGDALEFLVEVEAFIRRGRATGALLDAEDDRWAGQSLLDYWATMLDRAGRELPNATLNEFDPALAPELDDSLCPYMGLDAFREAHHDVFFGRQRLVEEMIGRLRENRLLAVVGPSGSGKSSLMLAGLLPVLKAGAVRSEIPAVPGSQDWCYYPPMVPGSNPLANLARLLRPSGVDAAEWIQQQADRFRQDPGHLSRLLREEKVPTVLVVDQFEELFTLCLDDDVRQTFIDNLLGLIQSSDDRHVTRSKTPVVILTMRVDFEPHVVRLPTFQPLFEAAQVRVTPLSAGELREAIEKPAALAGLKFEEGVVDALLRDILGEPAALPLLQFTLLKLWENRERNRVTWDAYQRLGGGRQALARSANAFYDGLIPEEQVTARRVLLRMVRPGEGLEVTSNRVRREALYQAGEARDRIDRVLDRLVQARLVRLTEGDTPGDAQVEVAHEALVRNWPRLVDWLEDERESMRRRLRLTAAAEQWETLDRDPGALLRGALLEEALRRQDLNELEAEFVQASQAAVERTEREKEVARQRELAQARALAEEQTRRAEVERQRAEEHARTSRYLRWLAVGLAGVLILAVVATVFALIQWNESQQLLRLSISHRLTAAAINNLDTYPERSILLALEAVSATYSADKVVTREADDALRRAMQASRVQLTLFGHGGPVFGVAFSPDGTRLATASGDRTVKIWDAASGEELLTLSGHTHRVWSVTFSPECASSPEGGPERCGTRLATASEDGTAKVWDAASGEELLTLSSHIGPVYDVAFSPDGARLATASEDGTARVWDATSGAELLTLSGHVGPVWSVAFSPECVRPSEGGSEQCGMRLTTAGDDETAKVWDVVSGAELLTLSGHTGPVYDVAFSPDGTRLATASDDETAKVWDVVSGEELLTLSGHTSAVRGVVFSPECVRPPLLSSSERQQSEEAPAEQCGLRLATTSEDERAKVWLLPSGAAASGQELLTLSGHTGPVRSVAFSPDGTRLATASEDRTARVWNVSASQELLTLSSHIGPVYDVAFSPECASPPEGGPERCGTRLATVGDDKTAKVWDLEASAAAGTGQELLTLSGHTEWISSVAFSPDGTRLATASGDKTAKVWNATSGEELLSLSGHTGWVNGVAFSPDGTRLATASSDGTAKVWDVVSGEELLTLFGHTASVNSVAFSPECVSPPGGGPDRCGARMATTSYDGTARVWDLEASAAAGTGQELLVLSGHTGWVWGVAFSPDGTRLATSSEDGTARVWDAASGQELLALSGHTDWVQDVAFSPDGMRLATASNDGTARVWDATSGEELLTLSDHTGWVVGVAFSPDGTRLATTSVDGTARVYVVDIEELMTLACRRLTRNLTQAEWETYLGRDVPYRRTCPLLPVPPPWLTYGHIE